MSALSIVRSPLPSTDPRGLRVNEEVELLNTKTDPFGFEFILTSESSLMLVSTCRNELSVMFLPESWVTTLLMPDGDDKVTSL